MLDLTSILKRFQPKNGPESDIQIDNKSVKIIRNWYEERYDKLTVQRNILFIVLILFLFVSVVSIVSAVVVINLKEFDPFVVQIDDSTGIAKVVNPVSTEILDGNEALAKYFIKKYLIARETYNPVDFEVEARKTVRLYSSNNVYWTYISYIKNKLVDPLLMYGQKNSTFLVIKSWSILGKNKYMVRFSLNENLGEKRIYNKLALVDFSYVAMELTDAERDINPIGFQVNGYRADDDNS